MAKYRKKPVVIEAVQVTEEYLDEKFSSLPDGYHTEEYTCYDRNGDTVLLYLEYRDNCVMVYTMEGVMRADLGDYIITGVNGEKYPCKPDIFEKTYEKVEE